MNENVVKRGKMENVLKFGVSKNGEVNIKLKVLVDIEDMLIKLTGSYMNMAMAGLISCEELDKKMLEAKVINDKYNLSVIHT